MHPPELAGVTIIAAGAFNPAILHPSWLAEKELIPSELAHHALSEGKGDAMMVSTRLTSFVADWLTVQITPKQAIFATVDQARELELRDLVKGILKLLPETPVDAIGINADAHFRAENQDSWHAFGDRFLPKDFWEPLFSDGTWAERKGGNRVGMRVMTVEVTRDEGKNPGFMRIEIAPSLRIVPNGIYVGINGHFQLSQTPEKRSNAGEAAEVLDNHWADVRTLEAKVISSFAEEI